MPIVINYKAHTHKKMCDSQTMCDSHTTVINLNIGQLTGEIFVSYGIWLADRFALNHSEAINGTHID